MKFTMFATDFAHGASLENVLVRKTSMITEKKNSNKTLTEVGIEHPLTRVLSGGNSERSEL